MDPIQLATLGKVMSHPIRLRIIAIMEQHERRSPNEVRRELDESVAFISYHMKMLLRAGVLRAAGTEPRRGAVEHFYSLETDSPMLAPIRELSQPAA